MNGPGDEALRKGEAATEAARQKASTDSLIQIDTRRQAAQFVAQNFPDADVEQAVTIAKDVQTKLQATSGSTPKSITQEERDKAQREGWQEFGETLPGITGAMGAPFGPVGMVVGAGIGAIGQSAINKITGNDVSLMDVAHNIRNKASIEALSYGAFDALFGGAARYMSGNKPIRDEIASAFAAVGMRPSLQDMSTTAVVEGARNVIGSLPLLNRPFKRRATTVANEFQRTLDNYIAEVSPDTILIRRLAERGNLEGAAALQEQLAEGVFDGLGSGMQALARERNLRFQTLQRVETQLEARAADSGYSLASPTTNTRSRIGQVAEKVEDMRASIASGALEEPAQLGNTIAYIQRFTGDQVARNMTFSELRRLKGHLGRQINAISDDPTSVKLLTQIKEGVEEDMVIAAGKHPELQKAYDDSMEISEEFLTLLQGMALNKGRRINKGLGRQGLQEVAMQTGEVVRKGEGSQDISTIVDTIAKSASPNEIRQFFGVLQRGMGEQEAQKMIRLSLGKKIQKSVESAFRESAEKQGDPSYVPGMLLRHMGLDTPNSPQFNATVALFQAAGMPTQRVRDIARVLDALFSVKNPRVSQMLQRQANLGGAKTVLRSVSGGMIGGAAANTAKAASPLAAIALYTVGRSYGKWVTNPARARLVITVADSRLPEYVRTRAMVSILTDPVFWTSENQGEQARLEDLRKSTKEMLMTPAGQKKFVEEIDRELNLGDRSKKSPPRP
jgi:hypothetical protein